MFCMLLKQTSRALNMELLCHYCHSGCLSWKHELNALPPAPITGYHPECHTPTIEPEADSDSWICRQCVFAVSTKVRLLISPSHTLGGKKTFSVQYGRNPVKYIRHCCHCMVVYSRKWVYSRKKCTNSLSIELNIRCSTLCLRNHKESIVVKLKNYAEVERSTFKVNQSHVLQFFRCEMRKRRG